MRITRRQLRQIIKEELKRSSQMNEEDLFSYDEIEREEQEEFARAMAKTPDPLANVDLDGGEVPAGAMASPAARAEPSIPAALRTGSLSIPSMLAIKRELPEYSSEVSAILNNTAARKKINDVYMGKSGLVLQPGSTGPDVKFYQAVVIANLMMWVKSRRSLVARSDITLDPLEVAQKTISTGGDVTDEDLAGAITNLVTMPLSSLVDGRYGPLTRAAVALLQTIMDRKQIIASFADGSSINWDAAIDGKIGRQTAQFLAGFTKLAAVTGVELNEKKAAPGRLIKEGAALDRWSLLAGIDKS